MIGEKHTFVGKDVTGLRTAITAVRKERRSTEGQVRTRLSRVNKSTRRSVWLANVKYLDKRLSKEWNRIHRRITRPRGWVSKVYIHKDVLLCWRRM